MNVDFFEVNRTSNWEWNIYFLDKFLDTHQGIPQEIQSNMGIWNGQSMEFYLLQDDYKLYIHMDYIELHMGVYMYKCKYHIHVYILIYVFFQY